MQLVVPFFFSISVYNTAIHAYSLLGKNDDSCEKKARQSYTKLLK